MSWIYLYKAHYPTLGQRMPLLIWTFTSDIIWLADKRTANNPFQSRKNPVISLHFVLTPIPASFFFIPSVFDLLSFASHSPPSFLHTPVSASLRSLCSPLGVADDRRLGGSTLSHCSNTASLICALMLLLIFSTHCGTYWHRATQAVTMHMHTGLHTHNLGTKKNNTNKSRLQCVQYKIITMTKKYI